MSCSIKYHSEEERKAAKALYLKEWRKDNPEKVKLSCKKSYENNKDCRQKYLELNKEKIKLQRRERYIKTKKHYIDNNNKRKKEREQAEPLYKFCNNIRRNIRRSFSRNHTLKFKKELKTEKLLGCSIPEFANYIILKCPEGITFKDFHQFGYHLDHIIPISSATTQEEVEKLCHFTNYQPLWWKYNILKSNKTLNYEL